MFIYAVNGFAKQLTHERAVAAIKETASGLGLHKVLEEHKPNRSHWHFKRGAGSGTLEVTWDTAGNTIQVIVHTNRVGADGWAKTLAPQFAQNLQKKLGGQVSSHVTHGN